MEDIIYLGIRATNMHINKDHQIIIFNIIKYISQIRIIRNH